MKDTTTTIDEILQTLKDDLFVSCNHGEDCDGYHPRDEEDHAKAVKQAKQALLQWHKDKARSYVPEKKEYVEALDLMDHWAMTDTSINRIIDNMKQAGWNEAIDQTLKAIEEDS